jgi:hypothetical protein
VVRCVSTAEVPPLSPIEAVAGPATMVQAHKVSSGSPKPTSLARQLSELEGQCLERRPSAFSPSETGRFWQSVCRHSAKDGHLGRNLEMQFCWILLVSAEGLEPSTPWLKVRGPLVCVS